MKTTDNGDGTFTHTFDGADLRAFVDARLQQAVMDKMASLSPEELAEWEAEEEQHILYGKPGGKGPTGTIYYVPRQKRQR